MPKEKNSKFYHLGNIEKTLAKLNAQNEVHISFLNSHSDPEFKNLWEAVC